MFGDGTESNPFSLINGYDNMNGLLSSIIKKKSVAAFYTSLVLLISFFCTDLNAQTKVLIDDLQFREDAQAAIDSLYNRNLEGTHTVLGPWKEKYPDHPIWALWDGMELWWTVLEDLSDVSSDEKFFESMQKADHLAGQLLRKESDHPDALIIRTVANGYVARHHANRGEWLTSVNIGRRAYQAHQRLLDVYPNLPDNDFAEGLKLYYSAYMQDNFRFVRTMSWFLPDGDRPEGLNNLRMASINGVFARPEASYFLAYILLNYENRPGDAQIYFWNLVNAYPDNGYFRRLQVRALFDMQRFREVIHATASAVEHWEEHDLPNGALMKEELYYWEGRARYHNGQYALALDLFKQSFDIGDELPIREQRQFRALSAFYAGRTSERLNQNEEARHYYGLAANQSAHEEAKSRAEERLRRL